MGDQVVARIGTAGRIEPLEEALARGVLYERWLADRDAVMAQRRSWVPEAARREAAPDLEAGE